MEDIINIEKGLATATVYAAAPELATRNTALTPLQLFQLLVGIHTPEALTGNHRNVNCGLYQRARNEERRERYCYVVTSFISNSLFLVQILIAATFTALSAYKDTNPVTLTVLGAFNTVLAGCLAWQKGQGVPQRYRKAQDHYQALLLDIEMTERAFIENASLDPRAELDRLQKIFDTAKADQQANYPDNYISTATKEAKDLAKQLDDVRAEAAKTQQDLLARIDTLLAQGLTASAVKKE